MSDDELKEEVNERRSEPVARKSRIYVRARDGTVTLSGQVSSFSEKKMLDAAAVRVKGIKVLDTQDSIERFAAETQTETEPSKIHASPEVPTRQDPVAIVASAGLRSDVPRAVAKAIVSAMEARAGKDVNEVRLALSNFDLSTLLRPDATVESLAKGLADLAHSHEWPALVRQCP